MRNALPYSVHLCIASLNREYFLPQKSKSGKYIEFIDPPSVSHTYRIAKGSKEEKPKKKRYREFRKCIRLNENILLLLLRSDNLFFFCSKSLLLPPLPNSASHDPYVWCKKLIRPPSPNMMMRIRRRESLKRVVFIVHTHSKKLVNEKYCHGISIFWAFSRKTSLSTMSRHCNVVALANKTSKYFPKLRIEKMLTFAQKPYISTVFL